MKRVSVALLVVAVSLWAAGCTQSPDTGASAATADGSPQPGKIPSVASMVSGLETRLEREPEDGKGWLLLAKSYQHLQRPDDARDAYNRAAALGESDPSLAGELFGLTPVAAQLLEGGDTAPATTR